MQPPASQKATWTALVLIGAGLAFRLWATIHARFGGDESLFWATARRLATLESFPVYGASITGSGANHPGPIYYYLLALPQRIGASPFFGSAFVALFHAFAAWLLFSFARRAGRERAGLFALGLFAFAPWDVLYADRIWGSCVAPAWSTIALYAAARAKDSRRWQALAIATPLVLLQMHMSAPIVWATCLILLILWPPDRFSRSALAAGVLLTLLAYSAPLYHEIIDGFRNTRLILSESGGSESWTSLRTVPLRVFGYGYLYATGEISYQFARGYWGGNFDDIHRFFTLSGWSDWLRETPGVEGALVFVSLLVGGAGWLAALVGLPKRVLAAIHARSRDLLGLGDAMTIALFVGLAAASILMMLAKKKFFPHYANVFVPMILWPVGDGLDRLFERLARRAARKGEIEHRAEVAGPSRDRYRLTRRAGRKDELEHRAEVAALRRDRYRVANYAPPLFLGAIALGMAGMAESTVRYYRTVDALNGLSATLSMVETVLEEKAPVVVRFDHFDNSYAWQMIAQVLHGRSLTLATSAAVRFRVHNAARFERTEPPPSGRVFDGVWLERSEPQEESPPGLVFRAKKSPDRARVEAIDAEGRRTACGPRPDGGPGCAYGVEPWQHFAPEVIDMNGRPEALLFMHPIQGKTVRAAFPRPAEAVRGVLRYGLSDGAVQSANTEPVEVRVVEGEEVLARASAGNLAGLFALPFTVSSTAGAEIAVEISAPKDGARVFGFDLELY